MKTLLLFSLLLAISCPAFTKKGSTGKSIQTNGSQSDVQQAINSAPDNGTVTVIMPAGTFDWPGNLSIRKAVSLAGAGMGETIIRNQNPSSNLIDAWSGKNGNVQIYGLSIHSIADNSGGRGFNISAGRDESSQYTVIIHDCDFDQHGIYSYSMLMNSNGMLIYNCHIKGNNAPNGIGGISFVVGINDYSIYNHPSTLGTKDPDGLHNSYVEDCYLEADANSNVDANSRVVWRHNTIKDCMLAGHGQETSPTGAAAWEFYDNTFLATANNPLNIQCHVHIRGGTGVFFNNSLQEILYKTQFLMTVFSITRGMNDGYGSMACPIEYPAPRQTGWAWADNGANWGKVEDEQNASKVLEGGRSPGYFLPNGKGAICDPIYIWNNTGAGANSANFVGLQTYEPDDCGNHQTISDYLRQGRDYFVNQGPKPGYAPYPYPHPLRTGGGPGPSPSPSASPTPTPNPTPTATPTPNPTPTPSPTPPGSHKYQILMESDSPMYMTPLPQR